MKGLELLTFLTKEQKEKLELSALNYKRFARIYIVVASYSANEVIIKIWQEENTAGKYLTSKELVERGKEVFAGMIPEGVKIHFRPIAYKREALDKVDSVFVEKQMERFNLQAKDLVKLLDIDKSTLSRTLSSEEMTKSTKAMFYYLFKYIELKGK